MLSFAQINKISILQNEKEKKESNISIENEQKQGDYQNNNNNNNNTNFISHVVVSCCQTAENPLEDRKSYSEAERKESKNERHSEIEEERYEEESKGQTTDYYTYKNDDDNNYYEFIIKKKNSISSELLHESETHSCFSSAEASSSCSTVPRLNNVNGLLHNITQALPPSKAVLHAYNANFVKECTHSKTNNTACISASSATAQNHVNNYTHNNKSSLQTKHLYSSIPSNFFSSKDSSLKSTSPHLLNTPTSSLPNTAPPCASSSSPLNKKGLNVASLSSCMGVCPPISLFNLSIKERVLYDFTQKTIHPAVVRVGLQMQARKIVGCNARTVAMLTAFQRLIEDYCPPPYKSIEKDLKIVVSKQINFITHCRPHNLAMGGVIRWFKRQLSALGANLEYSEVQHKFISDITCFINERILTATIAIAQKIGSETVQNSDNILIFGRSTAVKLALLHAKKLGKKFTVTIIDSLPDLEGQIVAREFSNVGIEVTYSLLCGLSYHINDCTKIFLGAATLLANSYVVNRAGAATVAMMGRAFAKPVLILCESYKLSDKILLDACCVNELRNPKLVWKRFAFFNSSVSNNNNSFSNATAAAHNSHFLNASQTLNNSPFCSASSSFAHVAFHSKSPYDSSYAFGSEAIFLPSTASYLRAQDVPYYLNAHATSGGHRGSATSSHGSSSMSTNSKVGSSYHHHHGSADYTAAPATHVPFGGNLENQGREHFPPNFPTSFLFFPPQNHSSFFSTAPASTSASTAAPPPNPATIMPLDVRAMVPCYDVTPSKFIDYIVTEDGVFTTSNISALSMDFGRSPAIAD